MSSAPLPLAFFARSALDVAPGLLGKVLHVGPLSLRINETEAYLAGDEASHSFNGMTRRNQVMFGEAGHCYVYFVYGMHWCANVVTGSEGVGEAVLLRGGTPETGIATMRANRPKCRNENDLANGPAKLCAALGLSGSDNGRDFCTDATLTISNDGFVPDHIMSTPRIGIRRNIEHQWRFHNRDQPAPADEHRSAR